MAPCVWDSPAGIASGKSTVSAMLAELGAVIIDGDQLAREVVERGTPGLAQVVEAFGEEILTPDGDMDRAAVGRIVFNDEAKRKLLESIVHPLVFERYAELEASAPQDGIVIHDIPLLAESGRADTFDAVLVVDVPGELQVERMLRDRGWTREDAESRIAAQATPRAAARDRDVRHRQHRDARRPPPAGDGGLRGAGRQAARSGSPRRRSFCSASRSSWRTRSAEMPCLTPMSASLCWRPSTRP